MAKGNIAHKLFASGPLILLYYLSISEVDTNLEKLFEVFSLNLQIIIIYFWIIKRPSLMGTGHIFSAGLINDVVMGFPLGISSLSYLVVCFVGNYVRHYALPFHCHERLYGLLGLRALLAGADQGAVRDYIRHHAMPLHCLE